MTQPITVFGKNIAVDFSVECFIHHDGLMNKGRGKVINIPITLVQRERTSAFPQQPIEFPPVWQPEINELVIFETQENEVATKWQAEVKELKK